MSSQLYISWPHTFDQKPWLNPPNQLKSLINVAATGERSRGAVDMCRSSLRSPQGFGWLSPAVVAHLKDAVVSVHKRGPRVVSHNTAADWLSCIFLWINDTDPPWHTCSVGLVYQQVCSGWRCRKERVGGGLLLGARSKRSKEWFGSRHRSKATCSTGIWGVRVPHVSQLWPCSVCETEVLERVFIAGLASRHPHPPTLTHLTNLIWSRYVTLLSVPSAAMWLDLQRRPFSPRCSDATPDSVEQVNFSWIFIAPSAALCTEA